MDANLQELLNQFREPLTVPQLTSATEIAGYLVMGGMLAIYLRWLYRWCSSTHSDTDGITRVFPLLTLVTAAVIAVVKSSLALSLGLVGALSIVRFRAAIKEPEELVYLFLCIAVGLSLGAEQPLLALALVAVASVFIVGMHWFGSKHYRENVLLTITGDSEKYFSGPAALINMEKIVGRHILQRLDVDNGRAQARLLLPGARRSDAAAVVGRLRAEMPDCEISYVNLSQVL